MIARIVFVAALAAALAACGEKPQTAATKKSDGKPWEGAQNGFVAQGWKAGDQGSWDAQMRTRAQGQNEYSRTAAQK
ncbi:MAG: hypothetical protein AB7U92_16775 [Piscinibacter sp.]|uniref:hypothetical protein n=1 Tax=Piscinibacter sp. TaxID=1903157 RepID=UPI003D0ADA55